MSRPTLAPPAPGVTPPESSARKSLWSYENKLVLLFFFAVGLICFDRLAINFLMPYIQQDLGINNTQVGMLSAAAALTWAIASVIGGRLSDKVPSKRMFLVFLIIMFSVASMMQGLVGGFIQLLILRLIMGLFEGPAIPVTQSVLAIESSPHRRGLNLGFAMNTAQGLFGSILAPIAIVALAEAFDWRSAFYFTMLPGLVIAFFVWRIMREPEAQAGGAEDRGKEPREGRSTGEIGQVLRNRNVLMSVLMFGGIMVFAIVLQVFGPLMMTNERGYTPTQMSVIMSAFGVGTALWGFVIPMVSDHLGRKPVAIMFAPFTVIAPFAVIYVDNMALLALSMFVSAAAMGVLGMALSVIPVEAVSPTMAGLAVGIPVGFGEILGGFLAPILAGALADSHGLSASLLVAAGGGLIATLAALFLRETSPRVLARRDGGRRPVTVVSEER
ncbi:MFS transporter [Corynebacterium guangdongense]|uniref:MFS family permease n=1 Tax=Corynebacterium guangdongense TaxID=1783348 RepID=A0ABU1ZTW8_9CORY|nr:MFS transporter [Corynebacterium guangdongense]MDR7328376.1 MFS family permease [Corynebacterium guangdongense]WJZ16953.1 Hexuronate transporter [Corynebacterium guangdongense]